MKWREATESETEFLKKKYMRQASVMSAMCAVSAAVAVYLLVRILGIVSEGEDRSYLAFSIFLLLVNLVFIGRMVFGHILDEVRRYRCVKQGKIRIMEFVAGASEGGQEGIVVDFLSDKVLTRERLDHRP